MNHLQVFPLPACLSHASSTWAEHDVDVINVWIQTSKKKMNVRRTTAEINWGPGGTQREQWMCVCAHTYMEECTLPECKRWIAMEMDCKPVGKQSNYDVLGSKMNTILGTGPLANSILHCIKWPITECVSGWFIVPKLGLTQPTIKNE